MSVLMYSVEKNPLNLFQRTIYANIETTATELALKIYSDVFYTINSEVSQGDATFPLVHPQLLSYFPAFS